jgi:hypothetical protein
MQKHLVAALSTGNGAAWSENNAQHTRLYLSVAGWCGAMYGFGVGD